VKRPEGFDRGQQPPAAPARAPRPVREKPARDRVSRERVPREKVPRQDPQREKPSRDPVSTPRPPRLRPDRSAIAQPARPRSARAEFAAADRRRRREERAEVRRFTRSSRRRRIGWLTGAFVLLSLVAMVVAAVFSPILALRHVTVDGTSRLDPVVLAEAVDGQLGTPLALLDENRIRSELGEFTLIRSYVTELVPPDTLLIHIVERAPIGVVPGPDGFRLVDPAGVTIDTTVTAPKGYPEIQLAGGDDVSGPGFRSMAEVLLALPPGVLAQVATISAQTKDDVTLTLTGSAQRVAWGSADDSIAKAAVLTRLIALHKGDGPGEYDVSAPGIGVFHAD
jgi:cell division protein FtsQ